MKKLDQNGLTGPIEIGLIVLAVLVVGFVGYRIGNARNDSNTASSQQESGEMDTSEIVATEEQQNDAKEVELPSDEQKAEEVSEPIKEEPSDDKPEESDEETKKKDITYISFKQGTANQNGNVINVTAILESKQTGTCYLKLYRNDQPKLIKEKQLTNASVCEANFLADDVPVSGEWEVHAWFKSSDGKVEAYMDTFTINVTT